MKLKRRLEQRAQEILKDIGIRKGETVLDFGCGSGTYTIPAARMVGEKGKIYALDKDERALDELMQRAERYGLENIEMMKTSGEIDIGLDDESVDVVLLYDIFWYFPLTDPRLIKLLNEVYRVTKPDALISVYPKHIDSERLKDKIGSAGFYLENRYSGMIIHNVRLERGQVLNFRKRMKRIPQNKESAPCTATLRP